ncbi:MAG: glycosyltransferase family 2 protein [Chloroherpetonaceae bacterium]|nr:glycosyltransferase family 2 protein [Chloroherpetonaceae bacterium]
MKTVVIIPAYNEQASIGKVIADIPKEWVHTIIVVDNNSTDNTRLVAEEAGARVVFEPIRGYGRACLKGIASASELHPDVILFLDGDYSDFPEEIPLLLKPILERDVDLVIGSRISGNAELGALLPQARFGNWLSTRLIQWFWGYRFTDLGPFRAIRWNSLQALKMEDQTFGWTVEMQVKAAKLKLNTTEVPVSYRKRIGKSKITGTISGTFKAGYMILYTIFKHFFTK